MIKTANQLVYRYYRTGQPFPASVGESAQSISLSTVTNAKTIFLACRNISVVKIGFKCLSYHFPKLVIAMTKIFS